MRFFLHKKPTDDSQTFFLQDMHIISPNKSDSLANYFERLGTCIFKREERKRFR